MRRVTSHCATRTTGIHIFASAGNDFAYGLVPSAVPSIFDNIDNHCVYVCMSILNTVCMVCPLHGRGVAN